MILIAEIVCAVLIMGLLAWLFFTAYAGNISKLEKLCRNKYAGLALSLPCALLCVPLAVPVSPQFLIIWLYPLAIVLPLLCYWHIDYYASRGLSFFLILLAYDLVHGCFELAVPGGSVITVIWLLLGIAGIWIAAKPCTLRDIFRKAAVSKYWKYSAVFAAAAGSLTALYILIMIIGEIVK